MKFSLRSVAIQISKLLTFVLEVKKQLEEKYGVKTMRAGGFTIKTSLDLRAQQLAEAAVANGAKLMNRNGSDNIFTFLLLMLRLDRLLPWSAQLTGISQFMAKSTPPLLFLSQVRTIKPILDYAPLFAQREGINYRVLVLS